MPDLRVLVVSDADAVEPTAQLTRDYNFTVIEYAQAINGGRRDLDGKRILCWPSATDAHARGKMRSFAQRLLDTCPEVKIIDTALAGGKTATAQFFLEMGEEKAFDSFAAWALMEVEGKPRTQILSTAASQPLSDAPALPSDSGAVEAVTPSPDWDVPLEAYITDGSKESSAYNKPAWVTDETIADSPDPDPVDPWGTMLPPELRPEWLPEAIAAHCSGVATRMGVDIGIFALFLLGVCAGLTTDEIRLRVRPDAPRWREAACLWIMIVGNSGTKKTPALAQILSVVWEIERLLREKSASKWEEYDLLMRVWEKKRDKYIAEQAGDKPSSNVLEEKPSKPVKHRIIVGNATVEALQDICDDQGLRGVLGVRDELVSLFTSANQYKRGGSDMQELMEGWNCAPHPVDRKGRDMMIKEYGFSLVGGTQPQKIHDIVKQLSLDSDGALQRFTPYLARQATMGIESEAIDAMEEASHARFKLLLQRLYDMQPMNETVKYSVDAQKTRRRFAEWANGVTLSPMFSDALKSHISKYEAFFNRFCLTYHAIRFANSKDAHKYIGSEIDDTTACQVATLFHECLFPHAEYFYNNTLSDGSGHEWERQFLDYVLARDLHTVSSTAIAQGWTWYKRRISALKSTKVTNEFWAVQQNAGYIFPVGGRDRSGYRATKWRVNEKVFDGRFASRQVIARSEWEKDNTNSHPAFLAQQQPREPGVD